MRARLARLASLRPPEIAAVLAVSAFGLYWLLIVRSLPSLDARIWYSPQAVRELLFTLGVPGRSDYFVEELVDLTWICSYTLLLLNVVGRKLGPSALPWCLIPGAFDLIETVGILFLIQHWPDIGTFETWLVVVSTPLKWGSLALLVLYYAFSRPTRSPGSS